MYISHHVLVHTRVTACLAMYRTEHTSCQGMFRVCSVQRPLSLPSPRHCLQSRNCSESSFERKDYANALYSAATLAEDAGGGFFVFYLFIIFVFFSNVNFTSVGILRSAIMGKKIGVSL